MWTGIIALFPLALLGLLSGRINSIKCCLPTFPTFTAPQFPLTDSLRGLEHSHYLAEVLALPQVAASFLYPVYLLLMDYWFKWNLTTCNFSGFFHFMIVLLKSITYSSMNQVCSFVSLLFIILLYEGSKFCFISFINERFGRFLLFPITCNTDISVRVWVYMNVVFSISWAEKLLGYLTNPGLTY